MSPSSQNPQQPHGLMIGLGASPGAASSALESRVQALRAAADQQAALQQQQQQQQQKEETDYAAALQRGAQPYQPYIQQTDPATGLIKRSPNPDAKGKDPARIQTFPLTGKQVYIPTQEELASAKKPALDDSNSLTVSKDLANAANQAGFTNIHEGSRLPNATGMTLLQHLNAAKPKDDSQQTLTDQLKVQQAGGTPVAPRNSTPAPWATPDSHIRVSVKGQDYELPTADEQAQRTQAKKTPKSYQFSYHTDDAGNVHVLRGDPESGDVSEVSTVKGAGPKRKDPDATPAPKVSAAQLRTVAQKKGDGLAKAETQFQKEMQEALTPEDKKAAADGLLRAKQGVQNEYEESLSALVGHDVGHFDYNQQTPAQAPQQASPTGGGRGAPQGGRGASAPASPPRTATLDQVRAFAKVNKMTEADAIRRAQGEGYQLTGK